jgi:hypothetical protein
MHGRRLALWRAVIFQAIQDAEGRCYESNKKAVAVYQREVHVFFRENSRKLADVCSNADLHEDKVRQAYVNCMRALETGDISSTRHRKGL